MVDHFFALWWYYLRFGYEPVSKTEAHFEQWVRVRSDRAIREQNWYCLPNILYLSKIYSIWAKMKSPTESDH
jgi:hypothetical protein